MRLRPRLALAGLLSLLLTQGALAATVQTFSPQGTVARVDQVRATFSEAMHGLGGIGAAAPFEIDCPLAGTGHWIDTRTWVWDAPPAELDGQKCTFTLKDGLTTLARNTLDGQRAYAFQLPKLSEAAKQKIEWIEPHPKGQTIREQQTFLLHYQRKLAGSTPELYCEDSAGRRSAVRRLNLEQWKPVYHHAKADPEHDEVVQCATPALSGSVLRLGLVRPGLKDDVVEYAVRPALAASIACSRLSERSACMPEVPVTLTFNGVVPVEVLNAIRLQGPDGPLAGKAVASPWLHSSTLTFSAPLQASASYTWIYPGSVVDNEGRAAALAGLPQTLHMAGPTPTAYFGATSSMLRPLAGASVPVFLRNHSAPVIRELVVGSGADAAAANRELVAWLNKLRGVHMPFGRSDAHYPTEKRPHIALLEDANAVPRTLPAPLPGSEQAGTPLPLAGYGLHVLEVTSVLS